MKILWTPEARQDRAEIWDYLFERDSNAAIRIDGLFSQAVAKLSDFPMLGHEGDVPGTRELTPHRSYRLVYEIYGVPSGFSPSFTAAASGRPCANDDRSLQRSGARRYCPPG